MREFEIIFNNGRTKRIEAKAYGWPQRRGNYILYLYGENRETIAMYNIKKIAAIYDVTILDALSAPYIYHLDGDWSNETCLHVHHASKVSPNNNIDIFLEENGIKMGTINLDNVNGIDIQ